MTVTEAIEVAGAAGAFLSTIGAGGIWVVVARMKETFITKEDATDLEKRLIAHADAQHAQSVGLVTALDRHVNTLTAMWVAKPENASWTARVP